MALTPCSRSETRTSLKLEISFHASGKTNAPIARSGIKCRLAIHSLFQQLGRMGQSAHMLIATDGRSFHISPPEWCELKQRFADQPTVSIIRVNRRSGAGVAGAFHVMGGAPLNVR